SAARLFHRRRRAGRRSRTIFGKRFRQGDRGSILMPDHIIERDPSDPRKKDVNPLLKLVLEMGPLMVFFFANLRGEWLLAHFPSLAALGQPIFVATGLFMAATVISLIVSWILLRT